MGDSTKYRPRSSYAQPGELDTSLLDTEFRRSLAAAEPKPNRANSTPPTEIPESEPASLPPNVPSSYSPQRLTPAPIAESRPTLPRPPVAQDPLYKGPARNVEPRPSPPRSSVLQDPFYKSPAPARNVEYRIFPLRPAAELNPNRKSLAPAPGPVEGKPLAFRLGIDPSLNRGNPQPSNGLAPPPAFVATPSVPLDLVEIASPLRERRSPPPSAPRQRPEPNPIKSPVPRKAPTLSTSRTPLVRRNVSARFELLPDAEPRWNQIGLSAAGQLVILGLALLSPMIFPQTMKTALKFDVIELMQPVTEIPVAPPEAPKPPAPKPRPKMKPKVAPKPPEIKPEVPKPLEDLMPKLNPKQPHVFMNLKPVVPKVHTVEERPLELKQNLKAAEIVLSSSGPKAPKDPGAGSPAPATVNAALSKVQTGGFGDPNGIGGPGNPNRRGNINQAGSPGLPGGPGYGNGTGGAQGLRGTVASDGSGKGVGGGGGSAAGPVTSGVAILYKPNPAYSGEGRTRKIQGDVVLEVVFLASGQLKVTRVVSGLGFGLDDEAIQAAQRIRFTPAKRGAQPVDFPARVRIEFRLVE